MKKFIINSYTKVNSDPYMINKINIKKDLYKKLLKNSNIEKIIINKFLYEIDKNNFLKKNIYIIPKNDFKNLTIKKGKTKKYIRLILDDKYLKNFNHFNDILDIFKYVYFLLKDLKENIIKIYDNKSIGSTGKGELIFYYILKEIEQNSNFKIRKLGNNKNIDIKITFNNIDYNIEIKSAKIKNNEYYYDFGLSSNCYNIFQKKYYKTITKDIYLNLLEEYKDINYKDYLKIKNNINKIKRQYISTNFARFLIKRKPEILNIYRNSLLKDINKKFNKEPYFFIIFDNFNTKNILNVYTKEELINNLYFERDHQIRKEFITLKPLIKIIDTIFLKNIKL